MQARPKSFFEGFTVAFSKVDLWEKCRELARILPAATPNELHVVFPQICGDIFGYGAGTFLGNCHKIGFFTYCLFRWCWFWLGSSLNDAK